MLELILFFIFCSLVGILVELAINGRDVCEQLYSLRWEIHNKND